MNITLKTLQEKGAACFFARKTRRGHYYKMIPEKMAVIQHDLDEGLSVYRTALNHGVSTTTISFHIKNGNLKKKTAEEDKSTTRL